MVIHGDALTHTSFLYDHYISLLAPVNTLLLPATCRGVTGRPLRATYLGIEYLGKLHTNLWELAQPFRAISIVAELRR